MPRRAARKPRPKSREPEPRKEDPARPRKRRTQRERTDSSRQELLRAALDLIAERGYRGASLAAIGERAGYSRGLVTQRFGSKEGLLRELVSTLMTDWRAIVVNEDVGSSEGVEALSRVIRAHRRALGESPFAMRALYVLLFESVLELDGIAEEFRVMDDRSLALAEEYIRRAQGKEIHSDVDPRSQALLLLAVVRGITLLWMMNPAGMDLDGVYRELERWIVRGLSAGEKKRTPSRRAVRS